MLRVMMMMYLESDLVIVFTLKKVYSLFIYLLIYLQSNVDNLFLNSDVILTFHYIR